MNKVTLTFVGGLFVFALIFEANAQALQDEPHDLANAAAVDSVPGDQAASDALRAMERQARNEAYKQRLRMTQVTRRQNVRNASSSLARQRAKARRERLASRTPAPATAPANVGPFNPAFNRLLNGEHIETLEETQRKSFTARYSGIDRYGSVVELFPSRSGFGLTPVRGVETNGVGFGIQFIR